jgi:hypothetical protein
LAGWLTDGLPPVAAITQNGTAVPTSVVNNNGSVISQGGTVSYTNVGAASLLPLDTELASGGIPQTVGATAFQIAALAGGLIQNTATSTVHTATLNTESGLMLTEALTTAAGATYTFQLVNSLILATSPAPQVQMHDGTNTGGATQVTSITNAAGTSTVVFTNTGTSAWNGTKVILFHV